MTDRRPRWVYEAGDEPDPRFSLANERTFLAWVRTSIGIMAGAVALYSLELPGPDGPRTVVLVLLLTLAAGCAVMSWLRWAKVERAMRRREPLPAFTSAPVVALALVLMAIVLAFVVVV
ncbi:DUF202 domain-containing protein [Aeromicrobium sp. Marseille-Q0843]|uniref:DUF202 domain-containing protein n=1 Tax=Aeromicrobium phoceense TaxID=2754045 RepID=A0A838XDN6_9ACTN|nr:DUF202 domain-containing protein [Aeromicrobium phoceense]MBA4607947.1 DUF202 domain-containing protein [Aeromicrobium phoceense]